MILIPPSALKTKDRETVPDQSPPSYDAALRSATQPLGPSVPSSSTSPPLPPLHAPTNHVSISRQFGEVKGVWVLDPRILAPALFLPPLLPDESEDSRKNLYIKGQHGAVTVDVTLLPSEGDGLSSGRAAAFLEAGTVHGTLKFKLHDGVSPSGTMVRLPVKIKLTGCNGAIHVHIPRSFRGLVNAEYLWGSVRLSDGVRSRVRYTKEEERMTRLFVGEVDEFHFAYDTWAGDEVNANTKHGNVYLSYDDEVETEGKGILSRFWGSVFSKDYA